MTVTRTVTHESVAPSKLWPAVVYYFCYFGALAWMLPFLPLHYQELGLTAQAIGWLMSIGPISTLIGAPLWGAVADATQQHRRLLLGAISLTILFALLLARAPVGPLLIGVATLYSFSNGPIISLVDTTVLEMLGTARERYGRLRLWGTVGWGIFGVVAGAAVQFMGLPIMFVGYATVMIVGLLAAWHLPVRTPTLNPGIWQGIRTMFAYRPWTVFLITAYLAGIGNGVFNNLLFLYMRDLNTPESVMGLALVAALVSEIPVFFFSGRLLQRWGPAGLLIFGMIMLIVRLLLHTIIPNGWYVLPLQMLHGFTFATMLLAGVNYAGTVAPRATATTAQGVFSGVSMGLGGASGSILGGLFYGKFGPTMMFVLIAALVACGLVFFLFDLYRASATAARPAKTSGEGPGVAEAQPVPDPSLSRDG